MTRNVAPSAGLSNVSDDAFLGGALMLLQPRHGYRAGADAVLLAAAAPIRFARAELVLDVGAGVGTVGLCTARRVSDARVVLLEKEPELVALARENVARNGLADRVRVVAGDVTAPNDALTAAGLGPGSFTHVLANPPFHAHGRGTEAPNALKSAAHAMPEPDLDRWARFLARMAAPHGTATIIHKAEALAELLAVLDSRFGALTVLPVHPREGEPAIRVIVQGIKGSRAPLRLMSGFCLHGTGQGFTPAAQAILRHGAPLAPQGAMIAG